MRKSLIVFMVLALFGCTKKEVVQAPPKKPLEIWVYDNGRINVLTELGKKFEAEYGTPVIVNLVDLGQIRNQLLLGVECADIALIPHDNLGPLVENGAVMKVNLGSKRASFLRAALDGFTYKGDLYGLPLSVENIGFFWNSALVAEPPATWTELEELGAALVSAGKVDVIMGLPDATYNSYPVYDSFGGAIFGKKSSGELDPGVLQVADEGFVKGLEFLTGLVKQRLVPETIDWDGAHVLFESARAPFIMTGPWALNRFRTAGVPYKIGRFPAASAGGEPGNPFMGVQGFVISEASSQKLLAQAFAVDFIGTAENMQALFEAEQRPSAWLDLFNKPADPDTEGFNAAGEHAVPMPSIPEMGYVWDAWVAAAALSFSGEKTPQEALNTAKTQIESSISE